MKSKLIKICLIVILIFSMYFSVNVPVFSAGSGAFDDMTLWNLWNPHSAISVNSTHIISTGLERDENGQVWYDFGAGYWDSDWYLEFTWNFSYLSGSGGLIDVLAMVNTQPGSVVTEGNAYWTSSSIDAIWVRYADAGYGQVNIGERLAGGSYYYDSESCFNRISDANNNIYCVIWFDDNAGTYGTLYSAMYDDAEHTIQKGSTASLALHEENSWRYMILNNGLGGSSSSLYYSGIMTDFRDYEANSVETTGAVYDHYNPYTDEYWYELSGNITNDGGNSQWVTLYWKESGGIYDSRLLTEQYNEGEEFSSFITVEDGITYYYYWEIDDGDIGEFQSEVDSFIADVDEILPVMSTSFMYDFTANGSNSYIDLSGSCVYDGELDVTGYIQYSENTTDWTDSDAYGSLLNSDDDYTITITGLEENTKYYYRTKGVNSEGTGYGGIFYFEIIDWDEPEISIEHENVTGNSVDIIIKLINDANESEIFTNFRIRIDGSDDWIFYAGYGEYMTENTTRTIELSGLTQSTTYDYQGYAFGQCYMQGFCENMTYTEIISFTTSAISDTPTVKLDKVGYKDTFTAYGTATVLNDAGWDCTISLEYNYATASDWRDNLVYNPAQYCEGLDTNDTCTTFIYPVVIDQTYKVRAKISNSLGKYSYSNIITYLHETGSTSTNATISTGLIWLEPVEDFLASYGLNNTGGRLLFIIVLMIIAFMLIVLLPGKHYQEFVKFTVPIGGAVSSVILILGMVINYVPPIVSGIILITFGGMIAVSVIKIFKGSSEGVE